MKLLIIHISDIHLKNQVNGASEKFKTIAQAVQNVETGIDGLAVVVSGDVAWSGMEEEYAVAKSDFESLQSALLEKTKVREVKFVFIPGNHDCNFNGDSSARDTIIQGIRKGTNAPIGSSILNVCCEVQTQFFNFSDSFSTAISTRSDSRIYFENEWKIGIRSLMFRCYNTAWLSQLKEQQGGLYFPLKYLGAFEPDHANDYVVSVFHHPYNWLSATNGREFRRHIEKTSDLILTGHEHEEDHYQKFSFKGEVTEYLEGAVFQEHDNSDRSGFNAIWINLETQKQKIIAFHWQNNLFVPDDISGGWVPYRRGAWTAKKDFELSPVFQTWLDDPGATFAHPAKPVLTLSDIFVFPNLREFKTKETKDFTYGSLVEGKDCLKVLGSKRKTIILARQQAGKTTLAKVILKDFYNKGITPVYIHGDDISPSVDLDKFEALVELKYKHQYQNPLLPQFNQLDSDKILIVIDDFDHTKLNPKGRLTLLRNINARFERVCVLGDDALKFEEIAYGELNASVLSEYAQFELMEFGHFLRSKLIERWYNLGDEYTANPQDLAKKILHAENLITSLIGKSYVPSFPIFVLSFLQAADSSNPVNSSTGTYGSLYEVLIIKALAKKTKSFNIDLKAAYLGELAYWMFSNEKKSIAEEEWAYFHANYCNKFKISPQQHILQNEFEESGLIDHIDSKYRFRHSYAYYFFVARYFRDNIHQEPVKVVVASLCDKLYKEEHANIWLFLTHLSKAPFIVDVILQHAQKIFAEYKPIEFGEDISFVKSLYDRVPEIVLNDTEYKEQKETRLRKLDDQPGAEIGDVDEDEAARNEIVQLLAKLNLAFRTIEVLGQLVKNFPGSLVGTDKYELVKECYLLGLRTAEMILGLVRDNADSIAERFVEAIREAYPKLKEHTDLENRLKQSLFSLVEGACFGTIKRISHAVGHAGLEETYREVRKDVGTNAVKLIDMSVKLDNLLFPEEQLKELKKEFRNNVFCDRLLRHLVVHYLYIFPTSERLKQKICAELEIPIKRLRGLDVVSQQQKKISSRR